ncbi:MAG: polyphosphate polymerase domain-containing protein [Butyrivibrio sp.]|nr:polyphosphate polymerase domain-containing protein [Butyrivibrio sp.]
MNTSLRKEIKYVLSLEQALKLRRYLEQFLHKDENSGENGIYRIRSQYYDSMFDRDLQDNLDGVLEKRKIRIRIYDTSSETAKLEYKCKSGSDGVKKVITISRDEVVMMENGNYNFLSERDDELAIFLHQKMISGIYRPKVIIEYERVAFTYPVSNTRITFDYNVKKATSSIGILSDDLSFLPVGCGDRVVLEIKYNDFLIEPIERAVRDINMMMTANSKYSMSRL